MDDLETRKSIQDHLEYSGMKADCTASLSKALEYAAKRLYCLLIIDLQLSAIDNAEMVHIFRLAKRTHSQDSPQFLLESCPPHIGSRKFP